MFSKTPEPKGRVKISKSKKPIFVIHHHFAKREHWDLRLEMDGVLASWAVPKEPPKTKNVRRLAIEVEAHPISYSTFHGIIPEGNYGAGRVDIWDKGKYELLEQTSKKILFELKGKKMKGKYVLVKTSYGEKPGKSWLWFKLD